MRKRREATDEMKHLASLDFRVDRHHFANHIGVACRQNHNPEESEHLRNVNTSVMEQLNSWFGRYRHSARYMNGPRFYLYLLIACHLNNRFRTYKQTVLTCEDESDQSGEE